VPPPTRENGATPLGGEFPRRLSAVTPQKAASSPAADASAAKFFEKKRWRASRQQNNQ